jgi:hypothetical protein
MSKVLQIRRGTAAQSNNFTGLAGEITMDTNTKTIRIHDGTTLGGFALARADLSNVSGVVGEPSGEEFNIESVPASFWASLFATYNLRAEYFLESSLCTITSAGYFEYIFDSVAVGTNLSAARADCVLVCQTPDAGFAIGEIAHAFGIGSRTNLCPNLFLDANGLRARLPVASETFWVSHKTTSVATNITNANWKIKFRIWY